MSRKLSRRSWWKIGLSTAVLAGFQIAIQFLFEDFESRVFAFFLTSAFYFAFVLRSLEVITTQGDDILDNVARPQVLIHSAQDWYHVWTAALRSAKHTVEISYMDNRSPLRGTEKEKKAYYERFVDFVKDNKVTVDRLDRANPDSLEWIEKVAKGLEGVERFTYAVWRDLHPERENLELVSVSIIDGAHTFLVAVGEQQGHDGARDIEVRDDAFAALWQKYYRRLWTHPNCTQLVKRGVLDRARLKQLREELRPRATLKK